MKGGSEMWNRANDPKQLEIRRREILDKGFELMSQRSIDSVLMQEVADGIGCGIATLYRYYSTKQAFVVAVSSWKWDQFAKEIWDSWEKRGFDQGKSAAVHFELYLDFFLELFRNHSDFLCFNQFFNVYIRSEQIDAETLKPYQEMIGRMREHFHNTVYLKAEQDHTIRTDESEEKMFSKTIHIMLAVVTRYSVGLAYTPEGGLDAMEELEYLKDVILRDYKTG